MRKPGMTSKERVLRTYNFQPADRIPIDFCACQEVYDRLCAHYGVGSGLDLMQTLHVDFRWARPKWIGPELKDAQGHPTDYFGIPRAGVGDFGYAVAHPLADVSSMAEVEAYPWPTAEMWDYDVYAEECRRFAEYAVYGGGWCWFFDAAIDVVGMERWMVMLVEQPEICHAILGKIAEFFYRCTAIMFQKAGDQTDIFFTGDDYGSQSGPLISLPMWRRFVRPHVERLYGLAHSYGLKVMQHSCGSVAAFLPDLIECGLNIIEPVQVRACGMDPKRLVADFGGKLCFHGSIDTQGTLPFGTPDAVRREVIERIETFRPYGGFTIAPTQHLLPEIPTANIVAMYETAWDCGWLD
jgi:uroporphyrinogen decarboxylase